MKQYKVELQVSRRVTLLVDADDEDDALDTAVEWIDGASLDNDDDCASVIGEGLKDAELLAASAVE